jgi:hypothetical protein
MPFLFWNTIREAKESGALELDLGRSDNENRGLITFKDRWGAQRSVLTYWRGPETAHRGATAAWKAAAVGRMLALLPGPLRRAAGRVLYPHIG